MSFTRTAGSQVAQLIPIRWGGWTNIGARKDDDEDLDKVREEGDENARKADRALSRVSLAANRVASNSAKLNELLDRSLQELRKESFESDPEPVEFARGDQYRKSLSGALHTIHKLNPGNPFTAFLDRLNIAVPAPPRGSEEAKRIARAMRVDRAPSSKRATMSARLSDLLEFGNEYASALKERAGKWLEAADKPSWTPAQVAGAVAGGEVATMTGTHGYTQYKDKQKAAGKPITRAGAARSMLWPLSEKLDEILELNVGTSPLGLAVTKARNKAIGLRRPGWKTKKVKPKALVNGSVPGDAPGSSCELSSLLKLLEFDDRPRNTMGEFTSPEDRPATNPNANAKVYGQFGKAAITGAGATLGGGAVLGAGKGLKALYEKIKGVKLPVK